MAKFLSVALVTGHQSSSVRRSPGRQVVGGDSGGGVWVNGRLAATMWTAVVLENTTTGEQRATDLSIAAVYKGVEVFGKRPLSVQPHSDGQE